MKRRENPHTILKRVCIEAAQWILREDFVHYPQPGGVQVRAGTPDVLACFRGRFMAIEFKTGKGRATPAQIKELRKVIRAGGMAFIIRSESQWIDILWKLKEDKYGRGKDAEEKGLFESGVGGPEKRHP